MFWKYFQIILIWRATERVLGASGDPGANFKKDSSKPPEGQTPLSSWVLRIWGEIGSCMQLLQIQCLFWEA